MFEKLDWRDWRAWFFIICLLYLTSLSIEVYLESSRHVITYVNTADIEKVLVIECLTLRQATEQVMQFERDDDFVVMNDTMMNTFIKWVKCEQL